MQKSPLSQDHHANPLPEIRHVPHFIGFSAKSTHHKSSSVSRRSSHAKYSCIAAPVYRPYYCQPQRERKKTPEELFSQSFAAAAQSFLGTPMARDASVPGSCAMLVPFPFDLIV